MTTQALYLIPKILFQTAEIDTEQGGCLTMSILTNPRKQIGLAGYAVFWRYVSSSARLRFVKADNVGGRAPLGISPAAGSAPDALGRPATSSKGLWWWPSETSARERCAQSRIP